MRFVEKLTELQRSNSVKVQANGTKLVGIPEQTPPLANHYIYAPMFSNLRKHLIESYQRTIPGQLLEIYEAANGCNLFWRCMEIGRKKFKIPVAQLSVFGVPGGTNTVDTIEPYNISVEDLNRPANTPVTWLKIGSYRDFSDTQPVEYDLFTDVETGKVYSVIRNFSVCRTEHMWDSIDECLCTLFDTILSLSVN